MRMTAYGYDFHQTTIAKIESAQRPLRVRELADFAALYGVEVQDLVYPPTRSLPEIDQEIADVTARLDLAREDASTATRQLQSARERMSAAQAAYQVSVAEVAVLEGRLASLSADREKVISWESDEDSSFVEGSDKTGRNAPEATVTPITSIAGGGPTVLRVILGAHLRHLRERANILREDAGYHIRASGSKIARLEAGQLGFKERDLVDLLDLYGVRDEADRTRLLELAQQANTPGWWHDYSDIVPTWFEAYIGLEMAASEMRLYEVQSVPELLQTHDYSRAVTARDQGDISTREIERRVRLRTERQARFLDRRLRPANLQVVLDEAVLRRQVGGPAVMHDQLNHLTEIAKQPNISVQVLPLETTDSVAGSFSILQFAEPYLPDVVYVEQLTSALYLDKPEEVDTYRRVIERLSSQALEPQQTMQFLRRLLQ